MRLMLGLLCAAVLAAQQADEVRNPRTSPEDVAAGAKTFRSHCSPCHGLHGEGGRGPRLANGQFFHGSSDEALLRNISNGISGTEMPGLFYSPDRVWQIVAYLRTLQSASPRLITGDTGRGKELFRAQCTGCHRVNGEGGRYGPDLSHIGQSRSREHLLQAILDPNADVRQRYWVVTAKDRSGAAVEGFLLNEDTYTVQFIDRAGQLHSREKSALRDYQVSKTSKMPSYQGKLSEEQVEHLIAYLSSLRPSGGQL